VAGEKLAEVCRGLGGYPQYLELKKTGESTEKWDINGILMVY